MIAAAHVLSISRSVPLDDYDEEVDVDSEIEVDNEIDNEESRLLRNRKKDNVGSLEKHVKSSGKNKDKDDVKRKSVKKPSGGGWNAASNLRIWLLIPPMIYYLFVAALLVKTILFGANGQSILTDTVRTHPFDTCFYTLVMFIYICLNVSYFLLFLIMLHVYVIVAAYAWVRRF